MYKLTVENENDLNSPFKVEYIDQDGKSTVIDQRTTNKPIPMDIKC